MDLPEKNLLLGTMDGTPATNTTLQRAANAGLQVGVAAQQFFINGNRSKSRRCLQQWHDFSLEDVLQRVGAPTLPGFSLLGRQYRIL